MCVPYAPFFSLCKFTMHQYILSSSYKATINFIVRINILSWVKYKIIPDLSNI